MINSGEAAFRDFAELPGELGTLRISLEPLLAGSESPQAYLTRLRDLATNLEPLAERGAQLVFLFAKMPAWLSASQDGSLIANSGWRVLEAHPPRDYTALQQLAEQTVRVLNATLGDAAWYEFWNEPNSKDFWRGSQDQLLRAYAAFALGARRADPRAQIGGLALGGWRNPMEREATRTPLLEAFIRFAARPPADVHGGERLPLDFVSWHCFGSVPDQGLDGVARVREWLADSGYPADTPLFITEWNLWGTFPRYLEPGRDDALGAAYLMTGMHEMDRLGVRGQTIAALQDFRGAPAGQAFAGDFGMLTRSPRLKKASYHLMELLARLGENRVAVELPDSSRLQGIEALATRSGDRITVLIHRFRPDPVWAFARSMREAGFTQPQQLGLTEERIGAFAEGRAALPNALTEPGRSALERARSLYRRTEELPDQVELQLAVPQYTGAFSVYRVDASSGNPGGAYRRARARGLAHAHALAAVRADQTLRPELQGNGELPALELGAHGVLLIELSR